MNVQNVLPKDAIPSIDDPTFGESYAGDPDDDVLVVGDDPPKAYPVRILNYHEIVNDAVDGDPVAVTWCPLCGSAVVYDRRVDDRVLAFGVSGKLADDDLVMYDRETDSEWKQSLGECIAGEFEGESLAVLPARMTTYEAFREAEPDGVVLQPADAESEAASDTDEPAPVDYDDAPYESYFESDGFGLAAHRGEGESRTWERDDIDPKTVVLGVEAGDDAMGFPLPKVDAACGVATATVGDRSVVVFASDDGVHAFENPGFDFEATADGFTADGTIWDPSTGESADGRTLDRLPARRLFAFAWQDDHGPDDFWSP
ncbi:DUF3179 domain-containing protein [Halobacterium bonnevillei]|uniref:DUF3179 domain-containing protein n=1 Tax=Halobacterium bonnevillei TaxID=2692200 RepID=A0A6B0SQI8_9EURY|nr:DUF3179 domain-containing protein [Halobacterium bonnevillei]MXR21120.1 DUF3179 domain-containing protein [Halobacterium bonnevillei]